ncbi:MAG: hypothetical protein FWD92_00020 [Methanomassiliicoccaceae archaeon]|nr:hypothetical protein [Methanomassiliicoccaceae archaeon]
MIIIMTAIPLIAFFGMVAGFFFHKFAGVYLSVVVLVATVILGAVSISVIRPLSSDMSSFAAAVSNFMVAAYIGGMAYGAYGAHHKNFERIAVAFALVLTVVLASAAIGG